MNAAQVRAKARLAMKRREESIEAEELEGGEINLIPYLDIITNLLLFLLASVSAGYILGHINTTLPNQTPANQVAPADPSQKPDETPIQIMVSATKQGLVLWSLSGLEGTLQSPKARVARLPATRADEAPRYDYAALNNALYEIANRRWRGKLRDQDTYEIILQCDPEIPYETVVDIMDAVRRRIPPGLRAGALLPEVALPKFQKQAEPAATPGAEKWVPVEPYDPDKHYLFPDILFAKWSFD
ncbi:MAG TPA: biopolymer transporter ExbD [Kofleriaceae bacterium]|nr:biopolymer transporter ExbD [Kofleriaceae bacterium]